MPKGEAQYIEYNPGEKPASSTPAEEGNYELKLVSKGKPGPKGWRKKNPKKFPNRPCQFALIGTEDEVTGSEKRVTEFMSLSPGFPLQRIANLAYAAAYPEKLRLMKGPKGAVNDPSVHHNMKEVDKLLEYIESNDVVLRGFIKIEAYNGEDQNKVGRWLPPDAELRDVEESSEGEDEEASEDEGEAEEAEAEESTDEEAEEEASEEAEEEAEEAPADEDEMSEDAEEDFEPVPAPLKKKKVDQGPPKKATPHPLKKVAKKSKK